MSKKDQVGAVVTASEKKVRLSTKGMPRVTAGVLAGGQDRIGYDLAVSKLDAAMQKRCNDLLAKAQEEGRSPRKIDWKSIFNGRSIAELTGAKGELDTAMANAAVEGKVALEKIIEKATKELAALKAAAAAKSQVATV